MIPGNLIHPRLTALISVLSAAEQNTRLKNSTRSPAVSSFWALTALACCCGFCIFSVSGDVIFGSNCRQEFAAVRALFSSVSVMGFKAIIHNLVIGSRFPVSTTACDWGSTMYTLVLSKTACRPMSQSSPIPSREPHSDLNTCTFCLS